MSHFNTIQLNYLNDKESLIAALKNIFEQVETHDEPQHLYGYEDDRRSQVAEIIVRRQYVGRASNDLGFKWNSQTNSYDLIMSDYDKYMILNRGGEKAFTQELATRVTLARLQAQGMNVRLLKKEDGSYQIIAGGKQNNAANVSKFSSSSTTATTANKFQQIKY